MFETKDNYYFQKLKSLSCLRTLIQAQDQDRSQQHLTGFSNFSRGSLNLTISWDP